MQTNDAETAGQIAVLEAVVPALQRLAGIVADQHHASKVALDAFEADPALTRLIELDRERSKRFDIFHVLGVQDSELAHSNFLAWLLDPNQSHGLGADFLKAFLLKTCVAAGSLSLPNIDPACIDAIDWTETEVRREWEYIDLLILNRQAKFAWAIENKIWADEGIGADGKSQLTWYRETLQRNFTDYSKHYVFLSPSGMPSRIAEERKCWTPEKYVAVQEAIREVLEENPDRMSLETRVILSQYVTMLGRKIVPESNEIAEIVRKIWLDHREAIELIIRYRPDFEEEAMEFCRLAIDREEKWVRDAENGKFIRFRSADWDRFASFNTGTGWPPSKSVLTFEVHFAANPPQLVLVLGPSSDERIRQKIHARVSEFPGVFSLAGRQLTGTWTRLHNQGAILNAEYLNNWNPDSVQEEISSWMSDFAQKHFLAINEVIVNCLREYEAEQSAQ